MATAARRKVAPAPQSKVSSPKPEISWSAVLASVAQKRGRPDASWKTITELSTAQNLSLSSTRRRLHALVLSGEVLVQNVMLPSLIGDSLRLTKVYKIVGSANAG